MSGSSSTPHVVIIGGGFAGAALAYHLLEHRSSRLRICVVEPRARLGLGVAYGAASPLLRLNVPASLMSIDPAQPLDFVSFADTSADPGAFVSRSLYGAYVHERLQRAAGDSPGRLQVVHATALQIAPGTAQHARSVLLDDGRTIHADRVVLATGLTARASGITLPSDPRIVQAWDEAAIARVPRHARLLLLGSGLSSLDVLRLLEDHGHTGEIVVMSRRGLLPRAHATEHRSYSIPPAMLPIPTQLTELISWTRRLVRTAERDGGRWQDGIDALRPVTQNIWMSLSLQDRKRFLRRVKPYWEVLRHRVPCDVLDRVRAAQQRKTLRLQAGRVLSCDGDAHGLHVALRLRGGDMYRERFDGLVCCLGPSTDIEHAPPLLAALVKSGQAAAAATGLGIETGDHGCVIDSHGHPSDDLFALGQLCLASRWETTGAPDIVRDAVALAERLSSFGP